jgi:CheY-like chemotaxis protein
MSRDGRSGRQAVGAVFSYSASRPASDKSIASMMLAQLRDVGRACRFTRPESAQQNMDAMANSILIVDDNQEVADLLFSLMLQHDRIPHCAYNGKDAIAAVRRHLPEVVICDLAMPGMSGFDVAETLSTIYGARCPIMIALTGWSDSGVAQQAIDAGFSIVLAKPADIQQLLSAIDLARSARQRGITPN